MFTNRFVPIKVPIYTARALIVLFNGNAHTANALLVSSLLSQSANRFCATTCVQLLCKDLCYLRMALTLCLHQFLCESWQICYRYT